MVPEGQKTLREYVGLSGEDAVLLTGVMKGPKGPLLVISSAYAFGASDELMIPLSS